MSTHDGGPAFPVADAVYPNGQVQSGSWGMSLRDWFAGQALAGMVAATDRNGKPNEYAEWSYQYADAMLAARGAK